MDRVVGDGVCVDGVERKNISLFVCKFVFRLSRSSVSINCATGTELFCSCLRQPMGLSACCPACAFQPACDIPHRSFANPASE